MASSRHCPGQSSSRQHWCSPCGDGGAADPLEALCTAFVLPLPLPLSASRRARSRTRVRQSAFLWPHLPQYEHSPLNFFVIGALPLPCLSNFPPLLTPLSLLLDFPFLPLSHLVTMAHSSHVHGCYSSIVLGQRSTGLVDVASLQVVPNELLGFLIVRANLRSSGSHGILHWAWGVLHQHCNPHRF